MGLLREAVASASKSKPILHFLLALSLTRIPYPEVHRDSTVVDDYFGTKISDPYRWLEDIDSNETQQFVQQQQNLTNAFIEKIPSRDKIRERLTKVWNYPKYSSPEKSGKRYYTFENTGLQNQSIMYVRLGLKGEREVFLDPNKLSTDGTVAIDTYSFTDDGELFTYAVSQSGSDWKVVRFKNVSTGVDLPDILLNTKFPSMSWSNDNKGVFYARYPVEVARSSVTENAKIYYHRIGTSQDEDILIAEFPEHPKRLLSPEVTQCGGYLVISGSEVFDANSIHVISLSNGVDATLKDKIIPVFPSATEATYSFISNQGDTFLFQSTKGAPNHKLITVNIDVTPDHKQPDGSIEHGRVTLFSTFLPEHPKKVINWASIIDGDKIVVCYLSDVKHTLELRSLKNAELLHSFDLQPGSISSFTSDGEDDKEFFFTLTSFLSPGTIFRCEVDSEVKCEVFRQIEASNTDLNAFVTEQVFYPSKDGTLIPMYIVRKKDVPLDGSAPALLYGYGGFNVELLPKFSVSNLVFVDNFNGIYALANIRGGGEYGEKWHQGGSLLNKQNVFDDFQAAAEYLIKNKYSSSSKIAIQGGSNGGLLVGACVNQRPDLFGAAIAQVGVMDMLRYQHFTIGYAWCAEYGCSDKKEYFDYLIKYSPVHNIRMPEDEKVQYPAVLVTTADHDDRVVPAHSYKYVAQLQHVIGQNPRQTNPLLLRVDIKAGHGAGKPTAKKIEEVTDIYAFLAETLDLDFKV